MNRVNFFCKQLTLGGLFADTFFEPFVKTSTRNSEDLTLNFHRILSPVASYKDIFYVRFFAKYVAAFFSMSFSIRSLLFSCCNANRSSTADLEPFLVEVFMDALTQSLSFHSGTPSSLATAALLFSPLSASLTAFCWNSFV